MKIFVVTPTFNEKKNIKELIEKINLANDKIDILVVDDNSPDGTHEIVNNLKNKYKNLHLLKRLEKGGLGSAYIAGMKYALNHNADLIIQMDADMSHDPASINDLIEKSKNFDLVIGSRYISGINVVNWPFHRLIISYGANLYSRIVTGLPIKDATGGYKCWKRKVLENINIDSIESQGYSFQIEMSYRAWIKKYKICEIPIIFIDRTVGQSKMNKEIMIEAFFMIPKLRLLKLLGKFK
ncbi:MAG: dolichyl-phosphate beta-D-mannosyltransferase [Candidatus Marinimicrobia bacterium]|nr:dolichyl-phosphate beta-D-mannosyltransferase [Candidatus Neomarinimicrobiota bacterium]|tara:strand:- start:1867 stop:2583 length:717 start_codon:yes stop_codon:yes gene_type:complete